MMMVFGSTILISNWDQRIRLPTRIIPPNFLTSARNVALQPGQSATLTFNVTVDNPFPTGISQILNTAYANASEIPLPVSDDARNIVNNPSAQSATVGDRVWNDSDGDGVVDVGEAGIPNVQVTLKDQFGTPLSGDHDRQSRTLPVHRRDPRQWVLC